jgi:hypothetical protein
MFPDVIKAYVDAMYVATTLRPPMSAVPAEGDRFADSEECRRVPSLRLLASRVAHWLRRTLDRRSGVMAEPTASVRPSFTRAPHS